MQFLYDNLTATIVAVTTTMLLLSIQSNATQKNVAQVSRNLMEEKAKTFATWLEKDLTRMGENIDKDETVPFENPTNMELQDGTEVTTQFTFYRDSTANDDETRIEIRYEVEQVGTRVVDGEEKKLFNLTRKKKVGGGSWSGPQGTSPSDLGYFEIDLLDKNANPVADPVSNSEQVHSVRVRFSVVSPFQNEETFPQSTHVGSVLLVRERNKTKGEKVEIKVPDTWTDCIPWGGRGGWKTLTHPDGSPFQSASDCFEVAGDAPGWAGDFDDFWD